MKPEAVCPNTACARLLDHHVGSSPDTVPPRPGDISICTHCRTVSFFRVNGDPIALTKADISRLTPADRAEIDAALTFLNATRRPST